VFHVVWRVSWCGWEPLNFWRGTWFAPWSWCQLTVSSNLCYWWLLLVHFLWQIIIFMLERSCASYECTICIADGTNENFIYFISILLSVYLMVICKFDNSASYVICQTSEILWLCVFFQYDIVTVFSWHVPIVSASCSFVSYLAMQPVPSPAGLVYLHVLLRGIGGQFFCFLVFCLQQIIYSPFIVTYSDCLYFAHFSIR